MSKRPSGARTRATDFPRGVQLLHDPLLNKGTAFTEEERDALGMRGLLPPRIATMQEQIVRVMASLRVKPDDLEKYIYLTSLYDRNETLFFRVVVLAIVPTALIVDRARARSRWRVCQRRAGSPRGPR